MDWFRHDIDAASDDKLMTLISMFGATGYGFYWRVLETLYKAKGEMPENAVFAIGKSLSIPKKKSEEILKEMLDLQLFFEKNSKIFSNRAKVEIQFAIDSEKKLKERSQLMNNARWGKYKQTHTAEEVKTESELSCKESCEDATRSPASILQGIQHNITEHNQPEEDKEKLEQVQVKKQSESSLSHSAQNAQFPPKTDAVKTDFFLTLKDGSKANVDGEWLEGKKALFQGMDVESELRKMSSWLDDNPMKRPLNWKRFAGSWLNRAWDDFRKGIKSNTKNLDYGMAKTSNADWIGQKGGLIEF